MKIALVRRNHASTGGAELYLDRLIAALVQAGHEPHLFAEAWSSLPEGCVFHPIAVQGGRADRPRLFAEATRSALAKARYDVVFSLERTLQQDVYRAGDGLHRAWLRQRWRYASLWRKPFIGLGGFHKTMRQLEAEVFQPANTGHVIVNSEMVRGEIHRHFSYPDGRIHLVRNGIDMERFRRAVEDREHCRARFGFCPEEFVLLFAGSGWERKGLRFLIKAWRKLRDPRVRLLVVGKGRMPLPEEAVSPGALADVEQAYAAADLFVFLPIYEPSANVCFEALASGLPVVTTRQNGASEVLVPGKTGHVIEAPEQTDAVVDAIRFWQARGTVRLPRESIPDLSLERNVRETLEVLKGAAASR